MEVLRQTSDVSTRCWLPEMKSPWGSVLIWIPVLVLALLVGMLVVGVVYGHKAHKSEVISSTKSGTATNLEVVNVFNPPHHVQDATAASKLPQLFAAKRLVRPIESIREGLSGANGSLRFDSTFPFVWSLHGQYRPVQNTAVPFLNMGIRTAAIGYIELPAKKGTGLRSCGDGESSYCLRFVKVKISDVNLRALLKENLTTESANRANGESNPNTSGKDENPCGEVFWPESLPQVALCLLAGGFLLFCGISVSWRHDGGWWIVLACCLNIAGLGMFMLTMIACNENGKQQEADGSCSHSVNTVPRKYLLTSTNYWGTVIGIGRTDMPNVLSTDKQVAVISALAEGSGIRQIERITGVHRDTIMRLGVKVGKGCANVLDRKMRNLSCNHLQFDEVWGFIGKKERHCTLDDSPEVGDVWTFCAIDSDTKIVPSFRVGKRDSATANAFVADVASRLKNRVQISSDALRAYVDAIELAFGANVDFAQIVKTYVHEDAQNAERKYSAPEFVIEEKKRVCGMPDMGIASTSHIERLNGTTRLHMRRLTRLTYAFSKKRENFEAAVALHFAYYNFVKRHNTLRCTPAMAAGIERDFWTVRDLVEAAA